MRRTIGLVVLLTALLLSGNAEAQDFIRYYPPGSLTICATGVFCAPTGMTSIRIFNGSNAEYGELAFASNILFLRNVANGGTARPLRLAGNGSTWELAGASLSPTSADSGTVGGVGSELKDVYVLRSVQGFKSLALTAGAATTFVTVAIPQTDLLNFATGAVHWTVRASDATDIQTLEGFSTFSCVNKADTETCAAIATYGNTAVAASGGSGKDDLACTITAVTGLTNSIGLAANCATTEMTETSLVIYYRLDMLKLNTITPGT